MKPDFQTLFPDNRQEGDTKLRQSQLVMLRILKIFNYLAQQFNFTYWLDAGTLLGAVRHKGFIPWDSDIDIGILRPDFDKFYRNASYALPHDIFLQTPDTDPHYIDWSVIRLRDKYSHCAPWDSSPEYLRIHKGLAITLHIYDYTYPEVVSRLHNVVFGVIKRLVGYDQYLAYWRFFALSPQTIYPLQYLDFEDGSFPCFNNYQAYLRFHFGDYMQFPPVEKQVPLDDTLEPFIPCTHKDILFWNEESRLAWQTGWGIKANP